MAIPAVEQIGTAAIQNGLLQYSCIGWYGAG